MGKPRRRAPRDRSEGDGDATGDVHEDNSAGATVEKLKLYLAKCPATRSGTA